MESRQLLIFIMKFMKPHSDQSEILQAPLVGHPYKRPIRRRGIALILVLAALLMIGAIVLSFLSSVTNDARSSSVFSEDARAKQLSETVTNLVMGQIIEATKGGNSSNTLAWASQPGAIRTYTSNGSRSEIFKLYSADKMVVPGNTTLATLTADDAPTGWASQNAVFTDLNAPVKDLNNLDVYPIVDPTAQTGANAVKGFSISGAPVASGTGANTAPMPARWIYMLKDGTLVSATGNATTATMPDMPRPPAIPDPDYYKKNPIVGRVAFWTDDETSKININTASGAPWNYMSNNVTTTWSGSLTTPSPANFWDTPIMGSRQDVNLAISQPWQGEFQRYPGHPATISLSAALPSLDTRDKIEALAPRLAAGGSEGGRVVALNNSAGVQTAQKLIPDPDRLYASVDELLFLTSDRSKGIFTDDEYKMYAKDVRRSGFFLTASSRAPEVTLFNTPRMVMWPIHTQASKRTAYDKLIAFCGTVGPDKTIGGGNSYYFTRANPDSATDDYNIARNQDLLRYLRTLTNKAVPGFGGSSGILGKYGADTEQITTQIFDYIRCINTQDSSSTKNVASDATFYYAPSGTIMPTVGRGDTRGFGRFPTLTKAGVMFWFNGNVTDSATGNATGVSLCSRLLLESFIASHGHPSPFTSSKFNYLIDGLDSLKWGVNDGSKINIFSSNNTTANVTYQSPGIHGRPHGGRYSISGSTQLAGITNSSNITATHPPNGFPLPPATGPDNRILNFSGGNITVSIRGTGNATTQNLTINLPAFDAPFPKDAGASYNGHSTWTTTRTSVGGTTLDRVFRKDEDVVRSVGVWHGDFRLTAASPIVAASSFREVDGYSNNSTRVVHNFLGEYPYTFSGAKFLQSNYYTSSNVSQTLATGGMWINGDAILPTTTSVTGDFDNGYGAAGDGPYIGFADEGNSRLFMTSYGTEGVPYLDGSGALLRSSEAYFSPNRLVPSAGIMGSLPTGVISQTPWQTLLFRPKASHPGANSPPDYLLLDLFNMPVVEPYAISEPLSTAGRVNMNYQILPFTYIKRSTAVQAALHTEWLTAIPNARVTDQSRKTGSAGTAAATLNARNSRWPLNLSETLKGFEERFDNNDIFRSPAEICSIPLVPSGASYSSMATWWAGYTLTGDNSKERPYARIYPKLTTKSNSFTVHFRVQVLKKNPNTQANEWVEGRDNVSSEYRGSTLIERYIDPNNTSLPDFATNTSANIDDYYRFRVIQTRKFAP
jgi:Tfp pilus assembly protein PilX